MKSVLLIGDSIRIGYQETVRRELEGMAEVRLPDLNGGNSINLLVHLHRWIVQHQPDLLHINCGLHDLCTIVCGERETIVPLDQYKVNIERILRTIRDHTPAKVIWATTTPVNEKRTLIPRPDGRNADRYESDVLAYNQAALEVINRMGVSVNDLYAMIMKAGRDECLSEDGCPRMEPT